jgi:hypothetical protein
VLVENAIADTSIAGQTIYIVKGRSYASPVRIARGVDTIYVPRARQRKISLMASKKTVGDQSVNRIGQGKKCELTSSNDNEENNAEGPEPDRRLFC